jgi:hypothetical protein
LENKKKAATNSPKKAIKRKDRIEEGRALGLGMKREHESIDLRA